MFFYFIFNKKYPIFFNNEPKIFWNLRFSYKISVDFCDLNEKRNHVGLVEGVFVFCKSINKSVYSEDEDEKYKNDNF